MDYHKIHEAFIHYCKLTCPRERLRRRDVKDVRLKMNYLYTEKHHIIPKKLGGDDSDDNLVNLLPEEHLFVHKLRYVAYNNRVDMLALRCVLNGVYNKRILAEVRLSQLVTKKVRKSCAWLKQNSAHFRKCHGWQTPDGVARISKARKGTIVVKDSSTGQIIGAVNVDHPKVLSGDWVHHTRGYLTLIHKVTQEKIRITSTDFHANKKEYEDYVTPYTFNLTGMTSKGSNNNNYSGITDQDILYWAEQESLKLGRVISYKMLFEIKRAEGIALPHALASFRFGGQKWPEVAKTLANRLNLIYNPFFRTPEQKERISQTNKKKVWITNNKENLRINITDFEQYKDLGYFKGRVVLTTNKI